MWGYFTDQQFNHIIEVLIYFKKCCPEKEVFLSEKSFKVATVYFLKQGIFNLED